MLNPRSRTRTLAIASLRDIDGIAEVVSYGRVRRPSGDGLEFEVEVYVAQLPDPPPSAFSEDVETHIIWVGCGHLDRLSIGSQWRYGRLAGYRVQALYNKELTLSGDEEIGTSVKRSDRHNYFPIGRNFHAPCFRLTFPLSNKKREDVIVPKMELLRYLFGVSSGFLLQLFDGVRSPAIANDRPIFSRTSGGEIEPGRFALYCNRLFEDAEAAIAVLVCTNEGISVVHDRVSKYLTNSPLIKSGNPDFVEIPFPFQKVRWEFEAIKIHRPSTRHAYPRLLITRIERIGIEFPYRHVEIHYPGAVKTIDAGKALRRRPRPVEGAEEIAADIGRRPGLGNRAQEFLSPETTNPIGEGVNFTRHPHGGAASSNSGTVTLEPVPEMRGSTDVNTVGGAIEVVPVKIKRKRKVDPEAYQRKLDAARHTHLESLKATFFAIEEVLKSAEWRGGFCGKLDKSGLTIVEGKFKGRQNGVGLVAHLINEKGSFILADVGTTAKKPKSMGFLKKIGGDFSDSLDLPLITKFMEKNNGSWKQVGKKQREGLPNWEIHAIVRPLKVWGSLSDYEALLRDRIEHFQ